MIRVNNRILFLFPVLLLTPLTHADVAPFGPSDLAPTNMPSMPSSEQDMNQLVQELEKATKEIDTFVKSLPPSEQEEFNRIVQQVEQKMSQTDPLVLERFLTNQMSPEELDQFLGNVFEGITPPDQKPAEEVVQPAPKPKKEEKPTPKEISKVERALETLNTIIKKTDSFIVKTQALPELAGKIKRWGKRGIIYDWEPSFEWEKVKTDIESLRQSLQKLMEKDPKNSTYKYLNDFIEQEKLVNNVEKLKTILVEYEPTIETSEFGLEKMSSIAKKGLTRIVSGFTEALYRLKLTDDLNKIFEKYEPRAKELREEKEKAEKTAAANQKFRNAPRQEMVIAGNEGLSGDFYSGYNPTYPDYSNYYTGNNPSYDYSSYDSSPSSYDKYSEGSAGNGEESADKGDKSGGEDKGGKGKTDDKTKPADKSKESDKEKKSDKESDKGSDKKDKESAPKKESEAIEKSLKEISEFMNIAGLSVKHEEKLKDISKHIQDEENPADEHLIELPLTYLAKAEKSITKMKQELYKKRDTQAALRVQKRLEDIVKEHKPLFDKVTKQIKEIEEMSQETREQRIPKEKRIMYLGEKAAPIEDNKSKDLLEEQPKEEKLAVTIFDLPKYWNSLQKAIKEFAKKPAPEPVVSNPIKPSDSESSESKK
jgi:hypothetical protein